MYQAAVPLYLDPQTGFREATPSQRFGLLLPIWNYSELNGAGVDRPARPDNKVPGLETATHLNENDIATLKAWHARQDALAARHENLFLIKATCTAAFTTGLGNEHPLENGFAFLEPYGLPYLAGSGVKGVLREAAHQLVNEHWGDTRGWEESFIAILFGDATEGQGDIGCRGVLQFWDVLPDASGSNLLHIDIMTPHQGSYYQQAGSDPDCFDSPHDGGNPNIIPFLTIAPGASMSFHVVCDHHRLSRLAPELLKNDRWKALLGAAFELSFEWLGFGAKTAVGYGAMESSQQFDARKQAHQAQQKGEALRRKEEEQAEMEKNAVQWERARVRFNRRNKTLSVVKGKESAHAIAPHGEALLKTLPAALQQKILQNSFVRVTAYTSSGKLFKVEAE